MSLLTNGGHFTTNYKCKVQYIYQQVWFNNNYITNVLSLGIIILDYRVTYDSNKCGSFIVNRPPKSNLHLDCHKTGLNLMKV